MKAYCKNSLKDNSNYRSFRRALIETPSFFYPMYMFNAYLIEDIDPHEAQLQSIASDAEEAMQAIGSEFEAFGGAITKEDLQDYRYKIMMPYFTGPEEIAEFDSFK